MGTFVSFSAGLTLLGVGIFVLIAYLPRSFRLTSLTDTLGLAIFLGFLAVVGNTLYWQVFGQIVLHFNFISVERFRAVGNWLDVLFKGGAAFSGYLHLRALWLQLDKGNRKRWTVFEMAFYPHRRACLKTLSRLISGKIK